jgi:hypothetical protein
MFASSGRPVGRGLSPAAPSALEVCPRAGVQAHLLEPSSRPRCIGVSLSAELHARDSAAQVREFDDAPVARATGTENRGTVSAQ